MAIDAISDLLDPSYLDGIESLPLEEVRERRRRCQEAADALSYLRRLVQGRVDLVEAEQRRRTTGERGDLSTLVEELKRGEILSDAPRPAGFGRLPQSLAPAAADGWVAAELDAVLDARRIGELPTMSDDELAEVARVLGHLERRVSDQRAELHDRADRLQEEVVRRYKSGEASVDSLLG